MLGHSLTLDQLHVITTATGGQQHTDCWTVYSNSLIQQQQLEGGNKLTIEQSTPTGSWATNANPREMAGKTDKISSCWSDLKPTDVTGKVNLDNAPCTSSWADYSCMYFLPSWHLAVLHLSVYQQDDTTATGTGQ